MVKNSPASAGDMRLRFDPWVRKIAWRRAWQPTPVFLPRGPHGQRSLVGYSPWGHKQSDTTEATDHTRMPCLERAGCLSCRSLRGSDEVPEGLAVLTTTLILLPLLLLPL